MIGSYEKCPVSNKIIFETFNEARDELFRIIENTTYKLNAVKPTRFYKCTHCSGFHLTHKPFITEY